MRRCGRGYPGRAAPPVGAEFRYPPKRLDRAAHPLAGPSPSPRGLPVILARAPRLWAAVAVRGCSARVVGLPPHWALGVGLALVLAAGGVAVRRHHCGTLLCFVLLYLCAARFRVLANFATCLCLLFGAALPCALRCLHEVWQPRLPG